MIKSSVGFSQSILSGVKCHGSSRPKTVFLPDDFGAASRLLGGENAYFRLPALEPRSPEARNRD
ncbi:MAG: hypothetical protein WA901_17505 [Phormidesmis sp.]